MRMGFTVALVLATACGGSLAQPSATAKPSASPRPAVSAPVVPPPVARAALPCGDSPMPEAAPNQRLAAWDFSLARRDRDLFVTAAIQRQGPKLENLTWGFLVSDGRVERIGDVGRAQKAKTLNGRGSFVLQNDGSFRACEAGATVTLPADPHAAHDQLVGASVEGTSLFALYAEPEPPSAACGRLTAGAVVTHEIFVERLDLASPDALWKTVSSRVVPRPTGSGCRTSVVVSSAVTSDRALAIVEQCLTVDAGDSISISDCALDAERFANGAWQRYALSKKLQSFNEPVAARDADRVAVRADQTQPEFRVYRLTGATAASEGDFDGFPIAFEGTKLARGDSNGKPGPSGVGFRIFVDELVNGAWARSTDPVETTGRTWGIDLGATPSLVVQDEHATSARLYTRALGKWQLVAPLPLD